MAQIVATDRLPLSEPGARRLTPTEVASLKQLASRKVRPPGEANVGRAIAALALREPSPQVARILARFLADEREDRTDRATAAIGLRLMSSQAARAGLVAALRTPDHVVRLETLKSLGAIGDADALTALTRMSPPEHEAERRQLALAKALIAHRLGRRGHRLTFRRGASSPGARKDRTKMSLRSLKPATVRSHVDSLRGTSYDIPLSHRVAFTVDVESVRWTLFVNEEVAGDGDFSGLDRRPWLAGLVARWDERTKSCAVQHLILTDPLTRGAALTVVRSDGRVSHAGRVSLPDGPLSFAVRDVARRGGAPFGVEGRVTARGVELDLSLASGRRRKQDTGDAVAATPPGRARSHVA